MIELRRKLSPQDAAVRKLWDIVEQVRKEVLAGDKPLKICAGDDKK